jgi:hypothetical protein
MGRSVNHRSTAVKQHSALPPAQPDVVVPGRLLWSIPKTLHALGIGRTTLYQKVDEGQVAMVKIDRRSFVTVESVTDYVDRLTEAATARAGE